VKESGVLSFFSFQLIPLSPRSEGGETEFPPPPTMIGPFHGGVPSLFFRLIFFELAMAVISRLSVS